MNSHRRVTWLHHVSAPTQLKLKIDVQSRLRRAKRTVPHSLNVRTKAFAHTSGDAETFSRHEFLSIHHSTWAPRYSHRNMMNSGISSEHCERQPDHNISRCPSQVATGKLKMGTVCDTVIRRDARLVFQFFSLPAVVVKSTSAKMRIILRCMTWPRHWTKPVHVKSTQKKNIYRDVRRVMRPEVREDKEAWIATHMAGNLNVPSMIFLPSSGPASSSSSGRARSEEEQTTP